MSLKSQIEEARGNAAELERLYRGTLEEGDEKSFKEAIGLCIGKHPDDILFSA